MMANPSWSEIDDNLFSYENDDDDPDHPRKRQTASDHPDIITRVFVQKIMSMLKDIKSGLFFFGTHCSQARMPPHVALQY